jgi:hypothetical protein
MRLVKEESLGDFRRFFDLDSRRSALLGSRFLLAPARPTLLVPGILFSDPNYVVVENTSPRKKSSMLTPKK